MIAIIWKSCVLKRWFSPLVGNCCPFRIRCTATEDDHVTVGNMSEKYQWLYSVDTFTDIVSDGLFY